FATLLDILLLFTKKNAIQSRRILPEKLSNGDENEIQLRIVSSYPFKTYIRVIDELPEQLQVRNQEFKLETNAGGEQSIRYNVYPQKRGDYHFGDIHAFCSTQLGLVERRNTTKAAASSMVYPSFIQMKKYELLAITYKLQDEGIKKVRRIGQNKEFEQIKEYVVGDDFRTINWKATARTTRLMVNTYQDEKSQQVYSIINKGRIMKMPFDGMTLLDYAINASLAISNIALKKDDKPGLITFQHNIGTVLPASKRSAQIRYFMDLLYREKSAFKETDYSKLYSLVRSKINKRSLLLMFTNFESLSTMQQQLPFLRKIAANHLLVCIMFENTELDELIHMPIRTLENIYTKSIAEKLAYEKKQITKELNKAGIYTILTKPKDLTINTVNKYLEIKARGII
ncbi:MAG: DUF58 domain-containing protein, partial [Bacteroidota bacterium]